MEDTQLTPSPEVVVISEPDAGRLVAAVDDCRASDVFAILKRQPWFRKTLPTSDFRLPK